ncbi:MAG: alkaline phosphatase family protein [Streptosporangiaceae bacterium]
MPSAAQPPAPWPRARFAPAVRGESGTNYPLAPDFQGCGYSDPDHSWEGWLGQHNFGTVNGFLQRPATPASNPGVTLAAANPFPVGYYTNLNRNGTRKALPDLPVIGALAEHYTTLDRYFCAFAGETSPAGFYQHAGQADRDLSDADAATAALSAGPSFVAACANGTLPDVCLIDPAFDDEGTGTSGDDHWLGYIRLGERLIADAYHALADNGYTTTRCSS